MNLPPEQAAKLETLLTDRQSAAADVMIAVHDLGLAGKAATAMASQMLRASSRQTSESIKSLLGPQGYGQFQNYEQTLPQRQTVNQLAQVLSSSGMPLNSDQTEQLVQVLATSVAPVPVAPGQKPPPPKALSGPLPGSLGALGIAANNYAPIPPVAVQQAQTILDPAQLAVLQKMPQAQEAQQKLGVIIRDHMVKKPH